MGGRGGRTMGERRGVGGRGGAQWFRRFYYSAPRAELTQVSVWQKSRTFGGLAGAARNAREEERGREGDGEEKGRKGGKGGGEEQRVQEGKEGDANVHGRVSLAHGCARAHLRAHAHRSGNAFAMRRARRASPSCPFAKPGRGRRASYARDAHSPRVPFGATAQASCECS